MPTTEKEKRAKEYADFMRKEVETAVLKLVRSSGVMDFRRMVLQAKEYGEKMRYHNQHDTYFGRVRETIGDHVPALADKDAVLDLGCSYGLTTIELSNIYPNCKVVGIEFRQHFASIYTHIVEEMMKDPTYLAKHMHPNAIGGVECPKAPRLPSAFIIGDGFNAPFRENSFEAIFMMNNLYFSARHSSSEKLQTDMLNSAGILKERGRIIISGHVKDDSDPDILVLRKTDGKLMVEEMRLCATSPEKTHPESWMRIAPILEACG